MSEKGHSEPELGKNSNNMRYLLEQNIGSYVVIELWFGGNTTQRRCGLLSAVGDDYFLLEDESNNQHIAGEISSIRLVTFCSVSPVPLTQEQTAAPDDEEQHALEQYSLTQAHTRPHSQAAFNYAKRKARKLD